MRQHHDLSPMARKHGDGRQHARQAGGVGDYAVFDRHVEIDAHQHALALDIDPVNGPDMGEIEAVRSALAARRRQLVHISRPMATAVSHMRLEKPHSLSYQDTTRQDRKSTRLNSSHVKISYA